MFVSEQSLMCRNYFLLKLLAKHRTIFCVEKFVCWLVSSTFFDAKYFYYEIYKLLCYVHTSFVSQYYVFYIMCKWYHLFAFYIYLIFIFLDISIWQHVLGINKIYLVLKFYCVIECILNKCISCLSDNPTWWEPWAASDKPSVCSPAPPHRGGQVPGADQRSGGRSLSGET